MTLARVVGVDPAGAIARFYNQAPSWVESANFGERSSIARLLRDLRGRSSIAELAGAMKRNRYAVTRWLKGSAQPRLPEFLQMVDVCTLRSVDLIACFVDPLTLPAVRRAWQTLEASRATVNDAPWSHAVLRALELSEYRRLPKHQPGWIAQRTGISLQEEQRCLNLLARSGQIRYHQQRWSPRSVVTVDTRHDPHAARKLAGWCAKQGADYLDQGTPGNFAFNLFAVSERDLERLRQLQRDYFRQLRSIVASSKPAERVVVANMQLFALDSRASDKPAAAAYSSES